jgi:AcrR family transcriptional regulator
MNPIQARTSARPARKLRLRGKHPDRFAEILRMATRTLATEGYAATNVNRIAELAGVGVGTLYNYFDDKDDLFLTCVDIAASTDFETKKARVDTSAPALEMLRTIIRVDQELMTIDPDGQQLLKSVFYGINSKLPAAREAQAFYQGSIELVEQALQKGNKEGVFDLKGETRLVALLVNGMMETFHVLREFLDERPGPKEHPAERAFVVLCHGILSKKARSGRGGSHH